MTLSEVIKVRVSKKELEAIKEQASKHDMKLSAWIRQCLFRGTIEVESVSQSSYRRFVKPGELLK